MSELTDPPFDTREPGPVVGRVTQLTTREIVEGFTREHPRLMARLAAGPRDWRAEVRAFAEAVLHGSPSHQQWLLDAAEAYVRGEPMPEERRPTVVPGAIPDVAAYRHVASERDYLVERVVLGTETDALEVVYLPLYQADLPEGVTGFARPLEMFMDGRFRRIRQ